MLCASFVQAFYEHHHQATIRVRLLYIIIINSYLNRFKCAHLHIACNVFITNLVLHGFHTPTHDSNCGMAN